MSSGFAIFWLHATIGAATAQNVPEVLRQAPRIYEVAPSATAKTTVATTFDPECPVCKDAREEIKRISNLYSDVEFYLILVHPNERVKASAREYVEGLRCQLVLDNGVTKLLGAKVMPEAFVFNDKGEVVYSGAIDDYFYKLGRRRAKITHRYVEDAIKALAEGKKPVTARVEPIGCYIER